MPQYLKAVSGYMKMVGLSVPDSLMTDTIKSLKSND